MHLANRTPPVYTRSYCEKKQQLETVTSESEARAKGFAQGDTFKLLKHDFVLLTEAESKTAKEQHAKEAAAAAKLS